MRKHIANDDIISMKEVKKIEKKMNGHAEHLVKITNVKLNAKQTKRIKGNLKTTDNQIPILSGTHKDHKKVENEEVGPDMRPIMGATVGPNIALTDFIARNIIRKVAEEASVGNDCKSTEELLNRCEEYNNVRIQNGFSSKNVIIASMDIDKLFPNMKIKPMMKEVNQMIVESKIEFKEIDYENASKYLGEEMTIEEILEEEMEEILYIEEEKLKNLKKAKNPLTNDVTPIKRNKAHKDCAKDEWVTNDVNPVCDDGLGMRAHKECAKHEGVTNDVTQVCDDVNRNKAHNDCAEDEMVTNGVTPVCDDGMGMRAHKECEEHEGVTNDVTQVCDDVSRNKAHNDCAEDERVTNDATPVCDDEMENKAHKECAGNEWVTNDVTPVSDDAKETEAHKECAGKAVGATSRADKKSEDPTIIPPVRNPTDSEERKMIGKIIEIMALAGMENHVYKFENIIRKQKSGGPIGLSLTGDIADCYLIGWDKKFREKLKVLRIEEMLYDRYKDDITIMADSIEKGSMFENDKITIDPEN